MVVVKLLAFESSHMLPLLRRPVCDVTYMHVVTNPIHS